MGDVTRILFPGENDKQNCKYVIGCGLTVIVKFKEERSPLHVYDISYASTRTGEVFFRTEYTTGEWAKSVLGNIRRVLVCVFYDDVSLLAVANTINCLLKAKQMILNGNLSQINNIMILDMNIYYKNPRNLHKEVLQYLTGSDTYFSFASSDTWTQTNGTNSKYVVMKNSIPHRKSQLVYIEFCFPSGKLKYHFFETPPPNFESDEMAITYKNTDLASFSADGEFFERYKDVIASRDEVFFPPGSIEWHVEGTDLIILNGVFSILHTHSLDHADVEYTFFAHAHMTYYAATTRIPLKIQSAEYVFQMIQYLCNCIYRDSGIMWTYITTFMSLRKNICVLDVGDYKQNIDLPIGEFESGGFERFSSYFLGIGDDVGNIHFEKKADGTRTIEFKYVHGSLPRRFEVEWKTNARTRVSEIKIKVIDNTIEHHLETFDVGGMLNEEEEPPGPAPLSTLNTKLLETISRIVDHLYIK